MGQVWKSAYEIASGLFNDSLTNATHMTALSNGSFITIWEDLAHSTRGQILKADGTLGASIQIDDIGFTEREATITALADGHFAVSWMSIDSNDVSRRQIKYQIFDNDGTNVGPEIVV